jgi:hypothetical protein
MTGKSGRFNALQDLSGVHADLTVHIQQKKARRSCGRKHTSARAFIIKLLIHTRRGVFRDV